MGLVIELETTDVSRWNYLTLAAASPRARPRYRRGRARPLSACRIREGERLSTCTLPSAINELIIAPHPNGPPQWTNRYITPLTPFLHRYRREHVIYENAQGT